MGYSYTLTNKTKIETFVDQIMDFYSLIMITEYMEESLILMAYELNWNIEDVRFFSVNKNANKDDVRDEFLVERVNEWSMADKSLYDRANATFWRKVGQFGFERMKTAKEKLIAMNNELYDYCVEEIVSINRTDLMKKASLAKLSPDDP